MILQPINVNETVALFRVVFVGGSELYVLADGFQDAADRARHHRSPDPAAGAFLVQSAELVASTAEDKAYPHLVLPTFVDSKSIQGAP